MRRLVSTYYLAALAAAAVAVFSLGAAAQQPVSTDYITITNSASSASTTVVSTPSGSLNDASIARQTSGATPSTTGSGVAPTNSATTAIPTLDLSSSTVPFLLQRPAPSAKSVRLTRPRVQSYFSGCSDDDINLVDSSLRINVSAVYTQFDNTSGAPHLSDPYAYTEGVLRIVGVGAIDSLSYGASNGTFSAIQVQSRFLTFDIFSNFTYLCDELYPTGPDNVNNLTSHASCTYGPGTVAFGVDVPLNSTYPMGTIWTRVLLVDASTPPQAIACIEVPVSRYDEKRWYWKFYLWLPIALFIGFFVTVSMARALTAATMRARAFKNRAREGKAPSFLRDHLNPVIISAISGQGMVLSPALLRFSTPGCWEILFHLQFIAAIAMMSVRWPDFSYPFFAQASWASLVGNVTIIHRTTTNALATNATLPTGDLGNQFANTSSPLYLNSSAPQSLINLNGSYTGIPAFAHMIGLGAEDLFGTCLAIWLLIVAVFVVVAVAGWLIDSFAVTVSKIRQSREDGGIEYHSPNLKAAHAQQFQRSPQLHFAALHGNIVRALAMFHLPITIFSVYGFANAAEHSTKTVALSIVAFVIISIFLPVWLLWRIAASPTRKLYDDIETLLALGPVYNVYSPGSQMFWAVSFAYSLIIGLLVGAGFRSGSAQAIVLLVIELLLGLATNLWLPWGEGAMMGPISFMTSVLRILTAVLVVLITPIVGLSISAVAWVTYVVLVLQGIFFAAATIIFAFKLLEALVRLVARVPYDEGVNARSGGTGGAIRQIRRRRDKVLRLSNGHSDKVYRRHSPASSSIMLADTSRTRPSSYIGTPGSTMKSMPVVGAGGAPIAMTRSRHASFASYLDYGNAASVISPPNGAYTHYFSHEGEDDDAGGIMTALPPVGTPMKQQPQPQQSFQRVGGGRATDSDPYSTSSTAAAAQFASQQSQSGGKRIYRHAEDLDDDDDDPWAGTWGTSTLSTQHGPWNGVVKMQAALAAMRERLTGQRGASTRRGRRDMAEDEQEEPAEEEPAPGQGGFQVIRAPRPGQQQRQQQAQQQQAQHEREPSWNDHNNEPMGSTAMAAATSLSRPPSMHGIEAHVPTPAPQQQRPPSPRPTSAVSAAPPMLELRHLTGGGNSNSSRPTSLNSSSALGILSADMQRAASMRGHDDAEEDAQRQRNADEGRFWLPPNRGSGGGEGVVHNGGGGAGEGIVHEGAERRTRSREDLDGLTEWGTMGSPRAQAQSAKIELMDQ